MFSHAPALISLHRLPVGPTAGLLAQAMMQSKWLLGDRGSLKKPLRVRKEWRSKQILGRDKVAKGSHGTTGITIHQPLHDLETGGFKTRQSGYFSVCDTNQVEGTQEK